MIDAENHNLVGGLAQFMDDDIRQAGHGPFSGALGRSGMSKERQLAEPFGRGSDPCNHARRSQWISFVDVAWMPNV